MRRLIAVIALAAALPAHAGLFDDEEARARIEQLRTDVTDLGKRADTLTSNQLDFSNQLDTIKADIAKLRGQVEVLGYDLDTAQKRQKDFYVDLDNRLRKVEQQQAALLEQQQKAAAAATPPPVDPQAEVRDYEAALTLFKAAKYKDAVAGFQGFIKAYASSTMLPSAYFWEGAALRQLRDYEGASQLFAKVAAQWPTDPKAADALLAQADCQQDSGDRKGARKTLESLVSQYPTSDAAKTAKQRLKKK